jgi:hypothetical protein
MRVGAVHPVRAYRDRGFESGFLQRPVIAARYSEVARLMRFTPAAANSATVNDFPLIPTMKLNGFLVGGNGDAESERGGSGGGAGMTARPVGALEITEAGTRFIPFIDPARLGMTLIVGFLIGLTISRGHARRRSVIHKTLGDHGRDDGARDLKTSAPSTST